MWLFFEALDVWMFRDGRPFSAGANHTATSLFPPPAFAVQGALRTLYLEATNVDWNTGPNQEQQAAVGWGNSLGGFSMNGPYLARWNRSRTQIERLFPLPADVVERNGKLVVVAPDPNLASLDAETSDLTLTLNPLNIEVGDDEPSRNYWMPESALVERYLNGVSAQTLHVLPERGRVGNDPNAEILVEETDLFQREYRYGTSLHQDQRTVHADKGLLYAASFIRPHNHVGILIELPDPTPLQKVFSTVGQSEVVRFGGEGRGARVTRLADNTIITSLRATQHNKNNGANKIVFLTPTYFVSASGASAFPHMTITSAVVKRPLALGGWDLRFQKPRPILRLVPASSVYYLTGVPTSTRLIAQRIGDDLSTNTLPLDHLGFGEYVFASTH